MDGNGKGDGVGKIIVAGGVAGGVAALVSKLLEAKPALAAPEKEKWDYLLECQQTIIRLLQQLIDAWEIGITVLTPWVAKAPEEIFNQAVRSVGTFDCDRMADYRNGKRILFKVESSLDQGVQIQIVGNIEDSMALATNLNAPLPVAPNGNISVGLAWDDWHPFVSARIIVGVAPTTGRLKIEYSIQE